MITLLADIGEDEATVKVTPEHGQPVTFEVRLRLVDVSRSRYRKNWQERYVVGLQGSDGQGFSHHTKFERAVSIMLGRARRYERAYSRPCSTRRAS